MAQGLEETVIAYLDTHVAIWLYAGLVEKLSTEARKQIEACDLLLSPMALLEFQYLFERKRISAEPIAIAAYLNATFAISLCQLPFPAVAMSALAISWTADPFDRIIVAQAQANNDSRLLTADSDIRKHYARAVW